jgi:hypothetical protein
MSHPLILKRRVWFLVPPQAGHAREMTPAAFAAGIATSGDGVCKELVFISTAVSAVACFARVETPIVPHRAARHGALVVMYVT